MISTEQAPTLRDTYLDLVTDIVLGRFAPRSGLEPAPPASPVLRRLAATVLDRRGLQLGRPYAESESDVEAGRAWPRQALTMVGRARLDNVRRCLESVIADDVPGDVIETGVWRGGASILMRAVLKAHDDPQRRVWVADSFQGLPAPDAVTYPADADALWYEHNDVLAVSLEQVRANFDSLRLLDDRVVFLEGFFRDTLPGLSDHRWSLLRLDGDLYESTIQALDALYPNLSVGGWVIVDDYGLIPQCKQAVTDFRERHRIEDPIETVDYTAVCWRRR